MQSTSPSIVTKDLSVRFGGHVAVNSVNCTFFDGTLTAILGPNGAGKTTYFNLLSGQANPTSGEIRLYGEEITRRSVPDRVRLGLGRAFQLTNLFPMLSAFENVRLAVQARRGLGFNLTKLAMDLPGVNQQANAYLEQVAFLSKRDLQVRSLPHGDQRKLEVAMLLALEPRVFMFDEPTAGMTIDETPIVVDLIKQVKALPNRTVLLVEHKMEIIRELADRVVIFHNGSIVADGPPGEVMSMPIVQEVYVGKALR